MITQKNNEYLKRQHFAFITMVSEYKEILTASYLAFSVDLPTLTTNVRLPIFQQFLVADKGLKLRFDSLKTDTAKLKLITETVDLDGYLIIDELEKRIKDIKSYHNRYFYNNAVNDIYLSFEDFLINWELDLAAYIDSLTINLNQYEKAFNYFKYLANVIDEFRLVAFETGYTGDYRSTFDLLRECYSIEYSITYNPHEKVSLDEMNIHQLIKALERNKKLEVIPIK